MYVGAHVTNDLKSFAFLSYYASTGTPYSVEMLQEWAKDCFDKPSRVVLLFLGVELGCAPTSTLLSSHVSCLAPHDNNSCSLSPPFLHPGKEVWIPFSKARWVKITAQSLGLIE